MTEIKLPSTTLDAPFVEDGLALIKGRAFYYSGGADMPQQVTDWLAASV